MVGAGRGFGEPTEGVNSVLGKAASTSSRMTPGNRHDLLERHARTMNVQLKINQPNLLAKQSLRARWQANKAARDVERVTEEASVLGISSLLNNIDLKVCC